MPLPLQVVLALAEACAPSVAASTLASIIQVESQFEPLAIGVNGAPSVHVAASDSADAAARARALIAQGRSVDLGLAQINSGNLAWLGLTVEDAFDPCRNLAAAARVLSAGFAPDSDEPSAQQAALRIALSRYNTGDSRRGFANGYVAKVARAAGEIAPALHSEDDAAKPAPTAPPAWDVFGEAGASFLIYASTATEGGAR